MTVAGWEIPLNSLNGGKQSFFSYLEKAVFHILFGVNINSEIIDHIGVVITNYPVKITETNVLLRLESASHLHDLL